MRIHSLTIALAVSSCLVATSLACAQQDTSTAQTVVQTPKGKTPKYNASIPAPTFSDISYGAHERQVLDVWLAETPVPAPLVLVIHGGGWQAGEKERVDRSVDVAQLLKSGILVAAINYRFVKQAESAGIVPPVKAPLHDAARALQFIRSKAKEWNIDKQRIGAAGGSAGACSSLWLAFHDDLADPTSDDPIARESTRLWCAAVTGAQTTLDPQQMQEWTPNSRYGGHAFGVCSFASFLAQRESLLPWIAEYSPYALVSRDDPPVYLIYPAPPALGQAQKDPTHTSNFGVKLQEHCRDIGVKCELVYPGAADIQHATPTAYLIDALKKKSPYDSPPSAKPPYYRVRYEGSSQSGELVYPVAYTVWIPPDCPSLRGVIVHQHGCGEGSCKSGQTGAFDLHWQALANKHDCALLSPTYEQPDGADCQLWCDPRHGSDNSFQQALTELGTQTGHPELARVPWALWGHSGGGHWAGGMLLLHPQRVAAVWLRSGVPLFEALEGRSIEPYTLNELATQIPVMCNLGTKEGFTIKDGNFAGVWPSNLAFFKKLRGAGGLVGIAVDPLTSHECGNQRYLAIPWFDTCLTARLPSDAGAELRSIDATQGWVAPLPVPAAESVPHVAVAAFKGSPAASIWLPDQHIAQAWSQYVHDTNVADASPPPAPSDISLTGNVLTWQAAADLESGLSHFIIEQDGVELAKVTGPTNPFGRSVFQGLQYSDTPATPLVKMQFQLDDSQLGRVEQFRVRSVNSVGVKSE